MPLTDSQKSQIESKKSQIESKKNMIESYKNEIKRNKENLKGLIKSSTTKENKEMYRRRLADSGEYTKKQIEQQKGYIQDLKEDIARIKQG
jgi:hypothetical protein